MGKCWRRVCEGDTLGACSRHLGEQARRLRVRDWHTIMTTGAVPSVVPLGSHGIAPDGAECVKSARVIRRE